MERQRDGATVGGRAQVTPRRIVAVVALAAAGFASAFLVGRATGADPAGGRTTAPGGPTGSVAVLSESAPTLARLATQGTLPALARTPPPPPPPAVAPPPVAPPPVAPPPVAPPPAPPPPPPPTIIP